MREPRGGCCVAGAAAAGAALDRARSALYRPYVACQRVIIALRSSFTSSSCARSSGGMS